MEKDDSMVFLLFYWLTLQIICCWTSIDLRFSNQGTATARHDSELLVMEKARNNKSSLMAHRAYQFLFITATSIDCKRLFRFLASKLISNCVMY